jgi:ABC-type polar amino acid transport system ATPase subunit
MTFVIVTHELASVFAIADRVIMLDKSGGASWPREIREPCATIHRPAWSRIFFIVMSAMSQAIPWVRFP